MTGYLGPEGSYSHLAAKKITGDKCRAYDSFPLLFRALISDGVDCIVIPVENSINGEVTQNIDLLQETDGIIAVEECAIKIEHRLATLSGADLKGIKRIYSHRQALDQCAKYLLDNFPKAQLFATSSTSASLDLVKTKEDACIVGAHTKKDGIILSDKNISDYGCNTTRFLKVVKGGADEKKHTEKIYFSVTCLNSSGSLLKLLQIVAAHGLNMTKLQSRPVKDEVDEFAFFIEIECDYASAEIRRAVDDIKSAALSFKLLGTY